MTELLQRCSCCKSTMLLETYFAKNRKGGWYRSCNSCRERQKSKNRSKCVQYKLNNKEKISAYNKQYAQANKEVIATRRKEYVEENKEEISIQRRQVRQENKEEISAYDKKYRSEKRHHCSHNVDKRQCRVCCPSGYLKMLVSARIREAMKANKSKKSLEYLGCDIATFRTHLESTFKENMTWENQGEWEIDHIIPVAYKQDGVEPSIEEVGLRLHYTNTQAMWASENRAKGNRYIG